MADVIKTKGVLQMVAGFADGDDRTFTVDNPKATVTAAQIQAVSDYAVNNNILIGDKAGANFTGIKSAKKIAQMTKYLDLNEE